MKEVTEFNQEGLVLWLDADDPATIIKNDEGHISIWKDKSGQKHDATSQETECSPRFISEGINGKPVIRFNGPEYLFTPSIRSTIGPVTAFVVTQRQQDQASEIPWQRLISSSDQNLNADNRGNGFRLCTPNPNGQAFPPTVLDLFELEKTINPIYLGRSANGSDQLHGDIAEILVFDQQFIAEAQIQSVLQYLAQKWQAKVAREVKGWTRTGRLGETPERKNNDYPLSDQDNQGQWEKYEPMWDEFIGDKLDQSKWWDHNPGWKGRRPALFMPSNVKVSDGQLHLTMREECVPNAPEEYHTFTSAAVQSKTRVKYGYFEIKARAMNSHGSSAFWFYCTDDKEHTEIDVFEIGGKAPGFEQKYNMNMHVLRRPEKDFKPWNRGGTWISPFNFTDEYHVFAMDWNEKEVIFYVDGVPVRKDNNTDWHQALTLNFDSETMPTWFGLPDPKDLPSTFSIEYVRAWKRKHT